MNFKLMVARTLVSIAVSSVSPAMATEVACLHRDACHFGHVGSEKPKVFSRAAQAPSVLSDTAPGVQNNDWPANLILG
jgi:hypothetical protein